MSDEKEDQDRGGALFTITEAAGDLIAGLPAPIRKNAIKAFGRLCTAAVEYPVALIENAIAEKRAESRARVKLIETSAEQIATQMRTNPEYVRAAASKFAHKIVRERVNVDQVAAIAAIELSAVPPHGAGEATSETASISEDWLNAFENEAAQLSSEQMHKLFGKILAGEIRKPTSFSIKALKAMAQLDNRAAALFGLLCSLSVSLRFRDENVIADARVISMGNAGANSLLPYGLDFGALNTLQEYGLVIADYNSWLDYRMAMVRENRIAIPVTFQGSTWGFVEKTSDSPREGLKLHGVAFSRVGRELLPIVDIVPNAEYTGALQEFLGKAGLVMTRINVG